MKQRPNFRIIEGETPFDYDGFKKDYCDLSLTVADIRKKYDLGIAKYEKYASKVRQETGFTRTSRRIVLIDSDTYIGKTTKGFRIQKTIDGTKYHIGSFVDFESAQKARDYLVANDWSWEAIKKVYEKTHGIKRPSKLVKEAMEKYDEFKDLYLYHNIHVSDIQRKLGINSYQYRCLVVELKKEMPEAQKTRYVPSKQYKNFKNPMHNIRVLPNETYNVYHKGKSYGTFRKLDDAVNRRNEMVRCNWND